ncbi:MAG: cytochrome c [Bdellovibrionaceae bacterium]|nr:cytochrome c [Pseudobdellovibrionaceae bacterium]
MLSKSQAKAFFLFGTAVCSAAFIGLTIDTFQRIPSQTRQQNMNPEVIRGKHLFEKNNCMGCHTIFGEGAYYAPELTKVFERRGSVFIKAILKDPEAMYPGQRKMVNNNFSEDEISDLTEFLKWIGNVDTNGFPPKPTLNMVASVNSGGASTETEAVVNRANRPQVFNQLCVACHSLKGQGGSVGPALDGVGSRFDARYLEKWIRDPISVKADSKMPKLPLSEADIAELVAYLSQLKGDQ